ncbi:MAG: 4Fe-4S cluster-binding domain-containing protein [Phycisphaerales bacterium]|nr:MAG: 4Fe-4S cluster-binding domain-containing protein [Phycisphaerales bacterium]
MAGTSLPQSKKRVGATGRSEYIHDIDKIAAIPECQRAKLKEVARKYAFRANDYYLNLIDWNDPADPIRQIIIPREEELHDWGKLDASNERGVTVTRGVQHKYPHTVLLLCTEMCGAHCRYCFRKRLFMGGNRETANNVAEGPAYVAANPGVTNVLLSGGDPLLLSTRRLAELLGALRNIAHVKIIRIGSKMPAFNPWRLLDDPDLQNVLRRYSTPRKRIYLMTHFDHPRELTGAAIDCVDCAIRSGVICVNQCPLVKGVNDNADVLATLFRELSFIGCPPYYVFQGRPAAGNEPYKVPIVRGWEIVRQAMRQGSGLACRARFVMSHETGKLEILSVDDDHMYLRYHRAKDPAMRGRFMIYKRDDEACWLDELELVDSRSALEFAPSSLDHPDRLQAADDLADTGVLDN